MSTCAARVKGIAHQPCVLRLRTAAAHCCFCVEPARIGTSLGGAVTVTQVIEKSSCRFYDHVRAGTACDCWRMQACLALTPLYT